MTATTTRRFADSHVLPLLTLCMLSMPVSEPETVVSVTNLSAFSFVFSSGNSRLVCRIFAAVVAGSDIAKVHRTERHDGLQRHVVTNAYAGLMRVLGVGDPDINGCPKLMSRQTFEKIQPQSTDWFIDAETIIKAEALGLNIHQHSAVMRARQAGISKVRLKTLAEFAWNISRWKATGKT